jgi:hypothetical protein
MPPLHHTSESWAKKTATLSRAWYIKTFAIYVASQATDVLNAIAKGGGTDKAFDATSGQAAFGAALDKIRSKSLACQYPLPTATLGQVDPSYLQLDYKSSPTVVQQQVSHKTSEIGCDSGLGWYYDNNASPKTIILCPDTCSAVQNNPSASIDFLVPCVN